MSLPVELIVVAGTLASRRAWVGIAVWAAAGSALAATGPVLIAARIDDKPGVGATRRDPAQIRERFMQGLGVRQPIGWTSPEGTVLPDGH
ncbi:MAG: hypothetical protein E6471_30695 [Bradyrhizobium sp.]|nr:hypothetical protein [Bradyrhizobium sp.]